MIDSTPRAREEFRADRQAGRARLADGTERDPDNVAPLVVYLATEGAAHVNGQAFHSCGYGYTLLAQRPSATREGASASARAASPRTRATACCRRSMRGSCCARRASTALRGFTSRPPSPPHLLADAYLVLTMTIAQHEIVAFDEARGRPDYTLRSSPATAVISTIPPSRARTPSAVATDRPLPRSVGRPSPPLFPG